MAVKSKNLRPNKRGMSIVSVLVAASIGMVVITGLISMITDVFKSQRSAQSKDAQREIIMGIRHLLSDPVICAASFGGGKPIGTGFNTTQIKDGATPPSIKYETGVNYFNNLVTITGFTVRKFAEDNPANPQNGKAELVIDTKKIGAIIGGEQMKGTILLLQVVLDASNNISQCYALGSADSLWQISPVDSADIYYSSGNVGIGTSSPQAELHIVDTAPPNTQIALWVDGNFRLGGTNSANGNNTGVAIATTGEPFAVVGNKMWFIRGNSDAVPFIGSAGSLSVERWLGESYSTPLLISSAGNVGIGTKKPKTE